MRKISTKWRVLLLALLLAVICVAFTVAKGQTYTLEIDYFRGSAEDLLVEIEQMDGQDIVQCVDMRVEDGVLKLKLQSLREGQVGMMLSLESELFYRYYMIYVHQWGIITFDHYLGDSNGGIAVPISITILLLCALLLLAGAYLRNTRNNMYQYKNIAYLGLGIFLAFALVNQIHAIFHYRGLIYMIEQILGLFSVISILILPIAFIVSVLVIISNLVLVKKEGLNLQNLLGLFIGALICFATVFPGILYSILTATDWINVHNQGGLGTYVYLFAETMTYVLVTYLECILLATVISGIRAAKHVPALNKDYILILGCQIRKDGSLTPLLRGRVDRALEFCRMQKERTGKEVIFVPSGGRGDDELISEAEAMKRYLLEKGVGEASILVEDKSKNTEENIRFSWELIRDKQAQVAFSTTNYHVFRAGAIAKRMHVDMEGIGAKTRCYFWINAFIREFVAALFAEKKKHVFVICMIVLWVLLTIGLLYLSNTL